MRIAIDISPIDSESVSSHKVRGVGKYITLLKDNLSRIDHKNTYIFTSKPTEENVDLIHYPYFDPFFINLPLTNKVKTIVTVHDVIPLTHLKNFPVGVKGRLKWYINKSRLKKADYIITDSMSSKKELIKVSGIKNDKIVPVQLAVDDDFKKLTMSEKDINTLKDKYSLPENFLLYVGDVTWNKNLPTLVKAVKELDYTLVMVGKALVEKDYDRKNSWNKDRAIIEELTRDDERFIKLGFVPTPDLVKIYNLATMLCMPSIDEGFGLPVLEAMNSACPVICGNLGSLPEVGGDAVVYIDPYESKNIKDQIRQLYESKDLQNELKKKGLVRASQFKLEKMILDTVSVYEKAH